MRGEVYEAITEIYRADQRLPDWVKELEGEHPTDFSRLALLGSLYEETGDATRALATVPAGARRASQADRSSAEDGPLASVARGGLDVGHRRVRRADSRGARQPDSSSSRSATGRCCQRGDRARAHEAPHLARSRAPGAMRTCSREWLDFYQREPGEGRPLAEGAGRAWPRGGQYERSVTSSSTIWAIGTYQDGNDGARHCRPGGGSSSSSSLAARARCRSSATSTYERR